MVARVVDSRPPVLLHPSSGYNCPTRCRLQMFLKPRVCVEYGNRTREHQSEHQSSYWLWTSVLNFSRHTCLTRIRLQMFLKPQVCVEYGNRTREHQSGHQSSYWLWTSVLNFNDLTRTGVTHSPHHPTK